MTTLKLNNPEKIKPRVKLKVAHGTHRGECKNESWTDAKLFRVLQNPSVDARSFSSYKKLDVDEKAKVKASSGYYKFGHYEGGIRKITHLKNISALAYDLDNATHEQIARIINGKAGINEFRYFAHTTRSHSPENPRWRIIVPLKGAVDLEKANAVARFFALELAKDPDEAIEIPDQVSFRNNQIAYRPAHCRGQEYLVHFNDGGVLDPDDFLESLDLDWTDHHNLPTQEGEKSAAIRDPNIKKEHAHDKPGVIGAFNRCYPITRALDELIPGTYEEGDAGTDEARFTLIGASGRNGAVLYDGNTFLASNHGTDPIGSGGNAWDVVRIHKFGHLDEKVSGDTPFNKLPSQKAMREWASNLHDVAEEIGKDLFDDYDGSEGEDDLGLAEFGVEIPKPKGEKKRADRKPVTTDPLERMNRNHAFINIGSSAAIADFRGKQVSFRSVQAFLTEYRNRTIDVGGKTKTLANWWLDHPERRSFPMGVAFKPGGEVPRGTLNLWTGWAVEPDGSKDCGLILDYIHDILAGGNPEHYNYIVSWLADIVQNPARKPGVALVLKGRKGVGKDTIVEILRRIVGDRHRAHLTDTKMVGDRFNAMFETALVGHFEEASWGGNMGAKGTLQALITSPTIRIERKGVDAIELESFTRLVFTANDDWVVPATSDERRYAVFDVSAHRKGDEAYWDALYEQTDSGGAAGFLAFLANWSQPEHVSLRKPPRTGALSQQKLAGLRGVALWWYGVLYDETLPGGDLYAENIDEGGWRERWMFATSVSVRDAYDEWRKSHRFKSTERNPAQFGKDLRELVPGMERGRTGKRGGREVCYRFPPLDVCRAAFAEAQGVELEAAGFPSADDGQDETQTG